MRVNEIKKKEYKRNKVKNMYYWDRWKKKRSGNNFYPLVQMSEIKKIT